jgi:hypothetical protein
MSKWLSRALASSGSLPRVPLVPIAPKAQSPREIGPATTLVSALKGPIGANDTIGTRGRDRSDGPVAEWSEAFAQLSPEVEPCPGLRHWPEVYARTCAFLEQHGEQAAELDWTTLELFGVHPEFGAIRVDCCGALILYAGGAVQEITAGAIRFERTTYRRSPGAQLGVPIWQFGRGQQEGHHE